jgi:hypothetical protein
MSSDIMSAMSITISSTAHNSYLAGNTFAAALADFVRLGGIDRVVAEEELDSAVSLN